MNARLTQIGFTLIEVLVGMVIIAVTLAAVSRAASHSIQTSEELKRRVLADILFCCNDSGFIRAAHNFWYD